MLEGLNDIQWGSLHDGEGLADDIPRLLQELLCESGAARGRARRSLFDRINPQGSGMQVTTSVVPFLFELVQAHDVAERGELIQGLVSIAIGLDSDYLPYGFDLKSFRSRFNGLTKRITVSQRANSLFGPHIQLACYEAVNERACVFVSLLNDAAITVRCSSAFAVCWFPECEKSLDALESLLKSGELKCHERANFQLSYAVLCFHLGKSIRKELIEPYLTSADTILQAASAIALAQQYPNETLVRAVLTDSASDLSLQNVYEFVPFNEGDLQNYAKKVLQKFSLPEK